MTICSHCNKEVSPNARYCSFCGNPVFLKGSDNMIKKLPSWVRIFLLSGGIILFMGGSVFFVISTNSVEGLASIIFLIIGFFAFRVITNSDGAVPKGLGIVLFVVIGTTIDQSGNYFYNKPIELIYCSTDTYLKRDTNIFTPISGTTQITQEFACYNSQGELVKKIDRFSVLGIRFLEYIVLSCLLFFLWSYIRKTFPEKL